jgi:hypothetical protein
MESRPFLNIRGAQVSPSHVAQHACNIFSLSILLFLLWKFVEAVFTPSHAVQDILFTCWNIFLKI